MAGVQPSGNIKSISIKTNKGFADPKDGYIKINGQWRKIIKAFIKKQSSSGGIMQPTWGEIPISSVNSFIDGFIIRGYHDMYHIDKSLTKVTKMSPIFLDNDESCYYPDRLSVYTNYGAIIRNRNYSDKRIRLLKNDGSIVWEYSLEKSALSNCNIYASNKGHVFLSNCENYGTNGVILDITNGTKIGKFDSCIGTAYFDYFCLDVNGNLIVTAPNTNNELSFRRIDKNGNIIERINISIYGKRLGSQLFPVYEDSKCLYVCGMTGSSTTFLTAFDKINKSIYKTIEINSMYIYNIRNGFVVYNDGGSAYGAFATYDRNLNIIANKTFSCTAVTKRTGVNSFSGICPSTTDKGKLYYLYYNYGKNDYNLRLGECDISLNNKEIYKFDFGDYSDFYIDKPNGSFLDNIKAYE